MSARRRRQVWHGANKRDGKFLAQFGQRDSRGGVAGNHNEIRLVGCNRVIEQRNKPRDQSWFGHRAIRKCSVVGKINKIGVGTQGGNLAIDGEAA